MNKDASILVLTKTFVEIVMKSMRKCKILVCPWTLEWLEINCGEFWPGSQLQRPSALASVIATNKIIAAKELTKNINARVDYEKKNTRPGFVKSPKQVRPSMRRGTNSRAELKPSRRRPFLGPASHAARSWHLVGKVSLTSSTQTNSPCTRLRARYWAGNWTTQS